MVSGFRSADDFKPVMGWELYQVTLDKCHVMFFFENGWQLLNVAHAFSYRSADGSVDYQFEVYGKNKSIDIDGILRERVVEILIPSIDRLALKFSSGDTLTIHDDPSYQSWWFMPVNDPEFPNKATGWSFFDDD